MRRIALVLCASLMLIGCHGGGTNKKSAKQDSGAGQKQDSGGGSKDGKGSSAGGDQNLKLDAAAQQRAGLEFQTVALRSVSGRLYASGRIAMNEERTAHVGVITGGRITNLMSRVGDTCPQRPGLGALPQPRCSRSSGGLPDLASGPPTA